MGGFISILSSLKRFYSFVFMYCMASLGEKLTIWQADKPKNKKNSQKVGLIFWIWQQLQKICENILNVVM